MGRFHKDTNTHRFQNFSERIASMHIDVVHHIQRKTDGDIGEQSTFFRSSLTSWVDLNCTQNFCDFRDDLSKFPCENYVQLVHHSDDIVATLKKHLLVPETLALEPLLDLLVQMARDMGPDFYPHFCEVFGILVQLLRSYSHDPDILEKVFVAMAYLHKFMWRYLVSNIQEVYGYFSSLLTQDNKDYVQKFAAESFAFLMRKVKDYDTLLNFLFKDLETSPQKTAGVGQLLFEMMKGVKQHFHTVSTKVFECILQKLGPACVEDENLLPWKQVEETADHMMKACAAHTNSTQAEPLWAVLLDVLGSVHNSCLTCDKEMQMHLNSHLCRLLRMLTLWLQHNNGSIIADPSSVAKAMTTTLKKLPWTEGLSTDLLMAISTLLQNASEHLSVETTVRLLSLVFSADFSLMDIRQFVLSLLTTPIFEKDIIPGLLSFITRKFDGVTEDERKEMLALVTNIILQKSCTPEDGSQLNLLKVYTLDFGRVHRSNRSTFLPWIQSLVETNGPNSVSRESLPLAWMALTSLPHISILDGSVSAKAIASFWNHLYSALPSVSVQDLDAVLYVMHRAAMALFLLRSDCTVSELLPFADVISLVKSYPDRLCVLHFADLYLSVIGENERDFLTSDLLVEIYRALENNLVSGSHKIRLLTLHILTLFPASVPEKPESREELSTVFTVSLAAERIPLTVQDYRHRLMHLRKLDHGLVHVIMPAGPFARMPMLYLMGNLLCPLTLVWEPVCELIATHAKGMSRDEFWDGFGPWLQFASTKAENELYALEENDVDDEQADITSPEMLLAHWMKADLRSERLPDYTVFRNQLWRSMHLFPEKCEPKSRDIVPLFLSFLENEYYSDMIEDVEEEEEKEIDDETKEGDPIDGPETTVVESPDTETVKGYSETLQQRRRSKHTPAGVGSRGGKNKFKTNIQALLAHLELFAKFQNPRSLYREPEVQEAYLQFLEHKNPRVQKVAFDCIMTYKYKYLKPYRENFERLLDNKTFKSEVVLFSVDHEASEIKSEHRAELLPVLMRILYGKMLSKAGNETSGRRRADTRRSIVLRFLAGCSPKEMQYFLGLVFGPFRQYVTDDPLAMVRGLAENIDLKKFVPPKRMKGVLGAVTVVTEKLGHLLEDNTRWVLHLLLAIGAMCTSCLKERRLVRQAIVAQLKSVRKLIFSRLIEFFGDFDKFEFTDKEVDAIMETFVWPQLDRLLLESKCQPSPLLKLLQSWSVDPRYFSLLKKQMPQGGRSALSVMFHLLTSPGLGRSVAAVILKTIENVMEAEDEVEEDGPAVKRRRTDSTSEHAVAKVTEGMLMIEPYIPALLTYIEGAVKTVGGTVAKDVQSVKASNKEEMILEMKILARITAHVSDEEQSVRLCSLLMPFLGAGQSLQQEFEESTLQSILNLVKKIANPLPFYRSLVPLFVNVERRQSRVLLCHILKELGNKVPDFADIADIVEKLNAWDPKRTEEPDYTLRLQAFRLVVQRLKESTTVDANFLLPLIYNCCFVIKNFSDLSLRDNATHCLVTIIQCLKSMTADSKVYRELVAETILPHVKKGLRSKQEPIRHEFLAVLQALVLAYPDQREFTGLSGLCDPDVDADFFTNIRHIQLHKQTRALRRLSRYLHNYKLSPQQHMGFVVPLLYSYLLDPRYAKSGGILDASVDLTCMVCRQLPWEAYFQLLRLYLSQLPRRLENQRIIIKVIVAILDGFHFDLSKSQFHIASTEPKVAEQENSSAEVTGDAANGAGAMESDTGPDEVPMVVDDVAADDEEVPSIEVEVATKTPVPGKKQKEFSADRLDMCPPGLATRIHRMVLQSLVPQLHKKLTEKVKSDEIHKKAGPKYAEDDEILRVPIAMAMIRLLQKLPSKALESRLPGILLRVCNFLKSRAESIRITARDTLVKIVLALGPYYLPFIIKEMRSVLTKGYQRHVLSFTLYHILRKILPMLKPGDLDPALGDLQSVFQEELFGSVSEEKAVKGITSKTFEAKAEKGFRAYEIMARFISPDLLGALVKPLKSVLEGTHSQKTANKVRLVLQKVEKGLVSNPSIDTKTMMIFIHTLTADNLPLLKEEAPEVKESTEQVVKRPESCFLLPENIPRGGLRPKTNKKTTIHVLIEFGLTLLNSCLKKFMLKEDNSAHLALLDPLVPSFIDCLSCKYIRVNAITLRCLCWLLKFPLPSLKKKIKVIAREMFVLLKNYASAGAAKGDNQELVLMAFKAVTVLVREVTYYKLLSEHLQVLLTFCESDLLDFTRQSTAFSVLKAILQRKLNVPELHQLMKTVESMAVTAEAEHLRLQCRQVTLQYLLDYPHGKTLVTHLEFFATQLTYQHEEGRQSVLEMLAAIFSTFPQDILQTHAGLFFVPMTVTLVNDDSVKCRKLASLAIKSLLGKVDIPSRDMLFSITVKWMTDKKTSHKTLAAQVCGLFVEVEAAHFQKVRLSQVLPIITQRLDPTKYDKSKDITQEQDQDHCLFNFLTLFAKILSATDILREAQWTEGINNILASVEEHLLYPHNWVRLTACQIFGQVFAGVRQDGREMLPFLAENPRVKIRKLVLDMCTQLQSPLLDQELANQVVKNMVFLAKNIHHLVNELKLDEEEQKKFSVSWLTRRLIREANFELINSPKITIKRNHVFKWVAAVGVKLDAGTLKTLLPIVLPALQRETTDQSHDQQLKTLALEVVALLKKKIGIDDFSATYASVQQARSQRKEKRKAENAISAVKTPEIAARKRMKKTKAKQEAKKRKMEQKKVRVKKSKLSIYLKER